MKIFIYIVTITLYAAASFSQKSEVDSNSTDPNNDMYVIHAMVYQVGILSNNTDDDTQNATMGNQEAITLYRTNGSDIDLSKITSPLVTNVTAQSLVGVAPKSTGSSGTHQVPWSALGNITNQKDGLGVSLDAVQWTAADSHKDRIMKRDVSGNAAEKVNGSWEEVFKSLFKRDVTSDGNSSVKILRGTAEIPPEVGVQSLALPPLLTLNNNFSDIPVPIPNTSVVHYAKINTLVNSP